MRAAPGALRVRSCAIGIVLLSALSVLSLTSSGQAAESTDRALTVTSPADRYCQATSLFRFAATGGAAVGFVLTGPYSATIYGQNAAEHLPVGTYTVRAYRVSGGVTVISPATSFSRSADCAGTKPGPGSDSAPPPIVTPSTVVNTTVPPDGGSETPSVSVVSPANGSCQSSSLFRFVSSGGSGVRFLVTGPFSGTFYGENVADHLPSGSYTVRATSVVGGITVVSPISTFTRASGCSTTVQPPVTVPPGVPTPPTTPTPPATLNVVSPPGGSCQPGSLFRFTSSGGSGVRFVVTGPFSGTFYGENVADHLPSGVYTVRASAVVGGAVVVSPSSTFRRSTNCSSTDQAPVTVPPTTAPPTPTTPTIPTDPSPAPSPGPGSNAGFVGLPWSGDALGRMVVKGSSSVAMMFTAEHSSSIASVNASLIASRSPWPANPDEDSNYAAGHGGTIRLDVFNDDNTAAHNPAGPSLGSFEWKQPMTNGQWSPGAAVYGYFNQLPLSNPVPVTAGRRYHLVWSNPHPAASTNWYGINFNTTRWKQFSTGSTQDTNVLPASQFDVKYRAVGGSYSTAGAWKSCVGQTPGNYCYHHSYFFSPIVSVNYANGRGQGNGYENFYLDPQFLAPNVAGSAKTRQIVNVASRVTIDAASFSAIPYAAGVARIRIGRLSDGAILATRDVPFSLAPPLLRTDLGCNPVPNPGTPTCTVNSVRLTAAFAPLNLEAGSYFVEFGSVSGSYNVTMAQPISQFHPDTYSSGRAETWNGSTWTPVGNGQWDVFAYLRLAR